MNCDFHNWQKYFFGRFRENGFLKEEGKRQRCRFGRKILHPCSYTHFKTAGAENFQPVQKLFNLFFHSLRLHHKKTLGLREVGLGFGFFRRGGMAEALKLYRFFIPLHFIQDDIALANQQHNEIGGCTTPFCTRFFYQTLIVVPKRIINFIIRAGP